MSAAPSDVRLRAGVRALVALPWPVKAWIARHPGAWRVYSSACRRLGWNRTARGWHTSPNGPFAGIRIEALHTNHLWAAAGLYEPAVAGQLLALLHDARYAGAEVWDVGAHRGLMSLLAARHGASRVLAIEPAPANLAMLERELAANPVLADRVEVMNAAVSDVDGEIDISVNAEDGSISQIAAPGVRPVRANGHDVDRAFEVAAHRLDSGRTFRPRRRPEGGCRGSRGARACRCGACASRSPACRCA